MTPLLAARLRRAGMKIQAKKGVTLDEIAEMLGFVVDHMATKDDIAEIRGEMATKDELRDKLSGMAKKADLDDLRKEFKGDMFGLLTQLNSIEGEIRGMKQSRLEVRIADLEEKVFGRSKT